MSDQPTIGSMVYYWPAQEGHHNPWFALVTGLWDIEEHTVFLHIFTPFGHAEDPSPEDGVYHYSEMPLAGHWTWPPRA